MVVEIIDTHFTSNLSYYKNICWRLCKGPVALDLLNETYLKLRGAKEELILKYHNKNKLKNLVIYYIRSLFQKRNAIKRNINGNTNQLFIHSPLNFDLPDNISDAPIISDERLNKIIIDCLSNPKESIPVSIFIQAQSTNVYEISKTSNISRPYLTKMYEEGRKILHKKLSL